MLEPSCGDGAFFKAKNSSAESVFIELDPGVVTDESVKIMDFFDYPIDEKFETIIGNPPYVDNSLFEVKHKTSITVQANLYLYFIEKCFYHLKPHGEMILIVPREFIKLTSAREVNRLLIKNGTITDYFDYGDEKLFVDACPNVCIFRYEKDNFSRKVNTFNGELNLIERGGLISFAKKELKDRFGDYFDVKVGAVSGADKYFESERGEEFVFSKTHDTGVLRKMIYQRYDADLEKYREILANRRIKQFGPDEWFMWGRTVDFRDGEPRVYVNCKTRKENPFFCSDCERWDGSILALFPKFKMPTDEIARKLNLIDWEELGFKTGGRYIFSQKALMEAPFDGTLFR